VHGNPAGAGTDRPGGDLSGWDDCERARAYRGDPGRGGSSGGGSSIGGNGGCGGADVGGPADWCGNGLARDGAPSLWLLEYGQVVAQTSYPELFAVLGTTYNTGGEGAGNFRLPDGRGAVYAGKADMGGSDKGNLPGGTVLGAIIGGQAGTGVASTVTIRRRTCQQLASLTPGIAVSDTRTWATSNSIFSTGGNWCPRGRGGIQCGCFGTTVGDWRGAVVSNQGSAASGGSGTGLSVVQPTGIRNKIIYAGR
jgi:microcystin-dependent protein